MEKMNQEISVTTANADGLKVDIGICFTRQVKYIGTDIPHASGIARGVLIVFYLSKNETCVFSDQINILTDNWRLLIDGIRNIVRKSTDLNRIDYVNKEHVDIILKYIRNNKDFETHFDEIFEDDEAVIVH